MKFFPYFYRAFCVVILLSVTASAQATKKTNTSQLPFIPGETLTYEAKISKIIRGIAVADLIFSLPEKLDPGNMLVRAEARSKGTLLKIARYSFLQEIESTIGLQDFRVLKTVKHDVQKDRVRNSEALFDYGERRVTYTETDPREPARPPRRIASEVQGPAHDLVSAIYSLRLRPLAVGRKFTVQVSDSGLVYEVPVRVTAREMQKSVIGNVMCFRLEPVVFGPGRLIEQEGSMVLWLTDDARRVPVRAQVNAPMGRIEIKLKSAKNLK